MRANIVTQKDIADALNVSVNTVSHALRGLPDISQSLTEKIRNTAREMGYIPNSMAIKLKTGSTKTIALVYDNLVNPFFTIMASKIFTFIKEKGYDTVIFPCTNYFEIEHSTLNELLELHVDGILSFLDIGESIVNTNAFKAFPTVIVGRLSKHNITSIYTDDFEGGRIIGRYFKEKGYKKILYAGPEIIEESSKRFNGIKEVYNSDISKYQFREGSDISKFVEFVSINKIEAVFAFNDVLANLIKQAVAHLGVEVAGYDYLHGQLPFVNDTDSISYDFDKIAELSVNSLFEIIDNPEIQKQQIKVPVYLHKEGEKTL